MANPIYILLAAFLSGVVGTGLGGLISVLFPRITPRAMKYMLAATAGLMLSIVSFELLPEAVDYSRLWGFLGLFVGIFGMLLCTPLIKADNEKQLTGKLVGTGIALHNFPEGLAIGASMAGSGVLGLSLAITIALHDIPEGVAMAVPMREGGVRRRNTVIATAVSGATTILGAVAGMLLGSVSSGMLAFGLGLAGGSMLQVTCYQLIPESADRETGGALMWGLLFGAAICLLLHTHHH